MSDTLTEIPERKAGKRGLRLAGERSILHPNTINLLDVLVDGVVPSTEWTTFDARGKIPAHGWDMDYNDELGCCGFAGADHGNMVVHQAHQAWTVLKEAVFPGQFPGGRAQGVIAGQMLVDLGQQLVGILVSGPDLIQGKQGAIIDGDCQPGFVRMDGSQAQWDERNIR